MADTDRDNDAIALEGLAELAEQVIPRLPVGDRAVWIRAVLRARRVALELRAGLAVGPPNGGPPPCPC